ncbi:MAG: PAS domain S-box protein, partial [Pyrinomonadaceae bacterium]|nr:PAS domain S-box protein [Pyrinomonadaceae bacterium]
MPIPKFGGFHPSNTPMLHTQSARPVTKILVICDAPVIIKSVLEPLKEADFVVDVAANAHQSLTLVSSNVYDAIVCDSSQLNYFQGWLKGMITAFNVPFLLIKGLSATDEQNHFDETKDYMFFPFRSIELIIKITQIIERRRSEIYHQQGEDTSPHIIYSCDLDGNVFNVNRVASRFFGSHKNNLIGRNEAELFQIPRQAVRTNAATFVHSIVKNNEKCVFEVQRTPIYHRNTLKLKGFQVVAQNITMRYKDCEALRADEKFFRALYQDSPLMYFVLNENGQIVSINQSGINLLGYPEDELIGNSIFRFYHVEDRPRLREQAASWLLNPEKPSHFEYRQVHKDGKIIHLATDVRMLTQSDGTNLFLGTGKDISTRKEMQTELEKSEAQFRFIVENFEGVVFTMDKYGVSTLSEGRGLKKLGLKPKEVVGQSYFDVYKDSPEVLADLRRALSGETFAKKVNLGDIVFQTQYYVHRGEDNEIKTISGVAIDITERSEFEKETANIIKQKQLLLERETLINRLATAIRSSLNLSEVLPTATRELGNALQASRVYLRLYYPRQNQKTSSAEYVFNAENVTSLPPVKFLLSAPITEFITRQREPIIINDSTNYDGAAEMANHASKTLATRGVKSAVFSPLLVENKFRGILCIEESKAVRVWSESDLALIQAVASQLSLAIGQAELFETTRRAKSEWETTFDAMSDGVFIFDVKGRVIRVNRAGAMMEKTTPSLLIGKKCCDVLSSESETSNTPKRCVIQEVIETKKAMTLETVVTRLNRPLLMTSEPIFDENHKLVGVVGTVRDLYELRQAELIAQERQSLLTNVLEGILEPIFAVDASGKLLWCNGATVDIYGTSAMEIARRNFLEMVHPDDCESAEKAFRASLQKQPQCYESRYLTVAGETRYAIFNSVPLLVGNNLNGVLWFVRDVTAQKLALETALQSDKLRALGQLASGVAHDFNNGLMAILGRVSLLQKQINDDNLLKNLQIIQTAAEDAAATVRRIQNFARQSTEQDFEKVELAPLVRDSIEITRTRWENESQSRGIFYNVDFETDETFLVNGDASELREVFINLIVNALDAMPNGGKLKISCKRIAETAILSFSDEGEGISE